MNSPSEAAPESYEAGLTRQRIESTYARRLYLLKADVASLRHYIAQRAPEIERAASNLRQVMVDDQEAGASIEGKALLKELAALEKTIEKLTA